MQRKRLSDLIQRRATRSPSTPAIGGQQGLRWKVLTSSKLLKLVDRLAAELATFGVGAGDRVVLWVPNSWRTPVYLFALWKLGAIVVPVRSGDEPRGRRKHSAIRGTAAR